VAFKSHAFPPFPCPLALFFLFLPLCLPFLNLPKNF
jgi:hypothetical protein